MSKSSKAFPNVTCQAYLVAQKPHEPSCDKHSSDEHDEAIQTIADLISHHVALRDSEDDRSEHCEYERRIEMR